MSRLPAAHDFDGWVAQLAHSQRRQDAKLYLRQSGAPALPAVRRGMHHDKPMVRRLCASILDHLADETAFVDLVGALDDDDAGVLKRALHALACDQCKENECRPGEELFVPRALELLHHENPDIRASAIDTLGKVVARRPDVAAALIDVSQRDRDAGLRSMARRRLPRVKNGSAEPPESPAPRFRAAWPSGLGRGLQSPVHRFDSGRRLNVFRGLGEC